jgi:two-component system KDP operon response regulator KdpE
VRDASQVPILVLSTRGDDAAAAYALDHGADDYLRKPFRAEDLVARVTAALRRRLLAQGKAVRAVTGEVAIDLLHRRVFLRGQQIELPPRAQDVLHVFAERVGYVLPYGELARSVWGDGTANRLAYLRHRVGTLRLAIEQDPAHPRYVVTELHVGYRLARHPPESVGQAG